MPRLFQGLNHPDKARVPYPSERRCSGARRGQGGLAFLRRGAAGRGGREQDSLVEEPDGDEREGRGRAYGCFGSEREEVELGRG